MTTLHALQHMGVRQYARYVNVIIASGYASGMNRVCIGSTRTRAATAIGTTPQARTLSTCGAMAQAAAVAATAAPPWHWNMGSCRGHPFTSLRRIDGYLA